MPKRITRTDCNDNFQYWYSHLGLTRRDVAKNLAISEQTVSNWLRSPTSSAYARMPLSMYRLFLYSYRLSGLIEGED